MFSSFTTKTVEASAKDLGVIPAQGLSESEASALRATWGYNELPQSRVRALHIFIRQFRSSFMYLLIAAAAISFALGEVTEGWTIIIFLGINSALGFYQEYRSAKTIELLKKFITPKTKVRRDGNILTIPSRELVPGDVVILEAGDGIPADIRFSQTTSVTVNEEPLTGESVSVVKTSDPLPRATRELYEASNIGFSGTTILTGRAEGLVITAAQNTIMGGIARQSDNAERPSTFEKELGKFSKFILYLVIITLVAMFLANLALKGFDSDILELAIFSIALAVSVVPEALPVVMAFSLSRGARHLAKKHVILKRLSALEDLGGIEVLCTDKTGTLTENNLTVHTCLGTQEITTERVIFAANLGGEYIISHNEGKAPDPFDRALWNALTDEARENLRQHRVLTDIPFDPVHKKNSVLVEAPGGARLFIVRGALEAILEDSGLPTSERERLLSFAQVEGSQGRRVLAVATKTLAPGETIAGEVTGYMVEGCVSFVDPIKESTFKAVEDVLRLKVKLRIITGDSREVTASVAQEIGLAKNPEQIIIAKDFFALSLDEQRARLDNYVAFARVSPEQKYALIQHFKERYQVGFLGEGINDAPALAIAHVALVVDSAADIAREAADIILLDRSLSVIVDGIGEGRTIFTNTVKYITSTIAMNFGNFYSVAISSLFIPFLPMLPLQILLVNLLSDFPAIAIASDTVETRDLAEPRHYNLRRIMVFSSILGLVSTVFDFATFASFVHISPESLQTHWFMVSIITELLFFYSIRTEKFFLRARRPGLTITSLTIVAIGITITLPFTTFGHEVFHFISPSAHSMMIAGIIVGSFFVAIETAKLVYYRVQKRMASAL